MTIENKLTKLVVIVEFSKIFIFSTKIWTLKMAYMFTIKQCRKEYYKEPNPIIIGEYKKYIICK